MAASFQVVPPEYFNLACPEQWTKWIRRFERFRIASQLSAKNDEAQVNPLIYAMGDEADDILYGRLTCQKTIPSGTTQSRGSSKTTLTKEGT